MRKWAVVNNRGQMEVWEYMDTWEDVKGYWYVVDAISKYGYDEIMPICMNRMGGYHSFSPEQIVEIIKCETRPTFHTYDRLKSYFLNQEYFCCGWIAPNGDTYSCGHYGHISMAGEIVDYIYHDSYRVWMKINHNAPDDFLLQNGWIKIDASKNHFCLWDPDIMSNEAIAKLDELEKKWGKK
jgi:hypothetical protein